MPNILDASGLQTATRDEWVTYFTTKYQSIYGTDVVLSSESPDGQWMNITIQVILDLQDLLMQLYTSMDPDQAFGNTLDMRVAFNGIQRQIGTYSVTPITISVAQSLNLYGLDQTAQDVFTVADNAGTQWQLQQTQLGVTAGDHVFNFQAAEPGAVLTIPNTITVPITVVLGVTAINNPTTYTTLGIDEEPDALLKIRRAKSVSLSSTGFQPALQAALQNLSGVTAAYVYENVTAGTNSDGVPGHSIWVIVSGTAAPADIAQTIYTKRSGGCGMYGSVSYTITQKDGSPFTVYWDNVVTRNLFVVFTVTSINGTTLPNIAAIRAAVAANFRPAVNVPVDITALGSVVQAADPNTLVTGAGFSAGLTQVVNFSGIPASGNFSLAYNGATSANILWNDSIGQIQTKVRAITGLSQANVTGSLASQQLVIDLSQVGGPQGLVTAATSNLLTSSVAAIAISFDEGYQTTLLAPTKINQFVVSAANVIILPMQAVPAVSSATHSTGSVTVTGLGGYGAYSFSLLTNNSGATINATTGVYTAGATPNVQDTVKITDKFGNYALALISVT